MNAIDDRPNGAATGAAERRPLVRWALTSLSLSTLLSSLGTSIANVALPTLASSFHAPFHASPFWMLVLLATGTLGFASVGTLFAAMLVRARSRDVLLQVLLYTITIPVIIAGVRGTAALLQATPDEPMARFWAALLVFFDVVFVTLSLWTFEPLMTES